jgi:hypothetical protein
MNTRLAYWTVIHILRFAYGLMVSIHTLRSVRLISARMAIRGMHIVYGLETLALRIRPHR